MSELHKFLFEGLPVRGMLVRLEQSWHELLSRRSAGKEFPPEVRELLGQMSAASTLMQANIKFKGSLLLQMAGDGPLKLAVAEVQPDLSFRATATLVGAVVPGSDLTALINPHGQGRCAITLDPQDRLPGQQPYQGIVPLRSDEGQPLTDIASALEHYMLKSEQLETRLVLAANDSVAAGLLIQRIPLQGEGNLEGLGLSEAEQIERLDAFNRISMLAATLKPEELLGLAPQEVLRRLFWQEQVRVFEPQQPRFACSCSRQRVSRMIQGLGEQEATEVVAEQGAVEVGCEFCGATYRFDAVDVAALFTATPGAAQHETPQ
ncbi:Hsp33 family molecular chaperone HslO [Roseateles sp. BYS180W]|uniref:Hsp33 family molecular chaperone HslO n=1 Tax=Roseateles rivi TaxID=3299028 RepID=A0ABW7FZJ8_9BURK